MADFLDTNIFVHLFDTRDPRRAAIAAALLAEAQRDRGAMISFQVVQETLDVLVRKLTPPTTAADARDTFREVLEPLWRVMPSPRLYGHALDLRERYGFRFYDSLIVAAALEGGCKRLLSDDLQHGQEIEGLRIENPFLAATA